MLLNLEEVNDKYVDKKLTLPTIPHEFIEINFDTGEKLASFQLSFVYNFFKLIVDSTGLVKESTE